jgi:hypothetical protein
VSDGDLATLVSGGGAVAAVGVGGWAVCVIVVGLRSLVGDVGESRSLGDESFVRFFFRNERFGI